MLKSFIWRRTSFLSKKEMEHYRFTYQVKWESRLHWIYELASKFKLKKGLF